MHTEGWTYQDGNHSYEASRNRLDVSQEWYALSMTGWHNNQRHNLDLSSPVGTRFVAGQSYPADDEGAGTNAKLRIAADALSCSGYAVDPVGTLNVLEAAYDEGTGKLSVFAATYTMQCGSPTRLATGEIRFNSALDYRTADSWGTRVNFGPQPINEPGASQKVVVEANGTLPTTFGEASVSGKDAAAFELTGNTCSGQTLSYGQTCDLTVRSRATAKGEQLASLNLVDNTFSGRVTRQLRLDGYVNDKGTYYASHPHRVLDTRYGNGAPMARVGTGQEVRLQFQGDVANFGSTVVINVTVADALGSGHISIYPTDVPRPTVSSLNYKYGWTGANSVTVKLGADGAIKLFNSGAPVHLIADLNGYYAKDRTCCNTYMGGQYHPFAKPGRLVDTREWGVGRVPADYYIRAIANWGATINPKIRAFAVNITATDPITSGYLSAWNGYNGTAPNTSTLNYTRGTTVSNFAVVPTMPCEDCGSATGFPSIAVYTNNDAHIIVDLVGVYDDGSLPDGLRFDPVVPTRITDTRIGQGWPAALGAASTATIAAPDTIAKPETWALATNVTAVQPTASTYLTVWPTGDDVGRPATSNLNPAAGSVVPNAVQTMIGPGNAFRVYNNAGSTHFLVDVVGTFYRTLSNAPAVPSTQSAEPAGELAAPQGTPDIRFHRG